jgi:NADH dehydrogenase
MQAQEIVKNFPGLRYFDKGHIATNGRKAAVAEIRWPFRANLERIPCVIDMDGASTYFFSLASEIAFRFSPPGRAPTFASGDGARLIVGSRELPGWDSLNKETMPAREPEVCTLQRKAISNLQDRFAGGQEKSIARIF